MRKVRAIPIVAICLSVVACPAASRMKTVDAATAPTTITPGSPAQDSSSQTAAAASSVIVDVDPMPSWSATEPSDPEAAIHGAEVIAIVRILGTGNMCMNSIDEWAVFEVVEVVRGGEAPTRAVADDHNSGLGLQHAPGIGYFVAGVRRSPAQAVAIDANACMGKVGTKVQVDGTVTAFVGARDLASARAAAAKLMR